VLSRIRRSVAITLALVVTMVTLGRVGVNWNGGPWGGA
jgi:hypothetical protein